MDSLKYQPPRQLHEQVAFYFRLREGQNEVDLPSLPVKQKRESKAKADREPVDDWGVCLPIVHAMGLFSTVNVEPRLMLVDFPRVNASLSFESPDGWKDVLVLRDETLFPDFPVVPSG